MCRTHSSNIKQSAAPAAVSILPQLVLPRLVNGIMIHQHKKIPYKGLILLILFPWLFPFSCRFTADLSSPHRPVRLLACSQSSTFQVSLARVFPSGFRPSCFNGTCICSSNFPAACLYGVLHLSSSHARTSSILSRSPFWNPAPLSFFPQMCSFLILSLRVTPYIHRSISHLVQRSDGETITHTGCTTVWKTQPFCTHFMLGLLGHLVFDSLCRFNSSTGN